LPVRTLHAIELYFRMGFKVVRKVTLKRISHYPTV
jgi:hypothetical protein